MSATFLDYDNDGHLDIYTGNMWTAAGLRVTSEPGFKPDAPAGIRELYKRHARGNSLFRNRGDGTFEDVSLTAGAEMGRWAWSSDALDFDNDGNEDLYVVNGMFTRDPGEEGLDLDSFFWRQVDRALAARRAARHRFRRRLARHQSPARRERGPRPSTSGTFSCATTVTAGSWTSRAARASTSTRTAAPLRSSTSRATATRTSW